MPNINYATQYQRMLANAFPKVLHFGALWNVANASKYRVVNANTVVLPIVETTGRVEGNRNSVTAPQVRHSSEGETKILVNHRKWGTLLHPVDIIQTNFVLTIQNITKSHNEQKKFKEMDCYVSSKLYSDWTASGGTANTEPLTKDNILGYIDKVMEDMDEAFVPAAGRILYVTSTVNTMLKNAKEIQRYLSANERGINRTVNRVDELTIESIPSSLMKTAYDFTEGAEVAPGAGQIDMMFLHPEAVLPIQTYSSVLLSEPTALSENKWVYFEEAFEDIFILNRRKDALAFHTTAQSA